MTVDQYRLMDDEMLALNAAVELRVYENRWQDVSPEQRKAAHKRIRRIEVVRAERGISFQEILLRLADKRKQEA